MESMQSHEQVWQQFAQRYQLKPDQLMQYQRYYELLSAANKEYDLTAITDFSATIAYHFADSLEIGNCLDLINMNCLIDVGTGAGFPGLALKIRYPHLNIILIEVLHKRINFLQSVIDDLQLTNISIYTNDWRTFLRKATYPADLITSRASLHPDELLRMFQPSSPYKKALLAYWASQEWQANSKEAGHILKTCEYQVKDRTRKYVIFKA
jgi:16S rRNA (guanine527-N7)-methyltransferase